MLIRLAALGALAFGGYRYYEKRRRTQNFSQTRDAGPQAMKDPATDTWDMIDEASDPPANY